MKKRVVHIITGLGKGGAETMLTNTLRFADRERFDFEVVSFTKNGYYKPVLEELGIPISEISLKPNPFRGIFALRKICKSADTVCCWMYHANLIGLICAKLAGVKRIIWGIRHSNLDKKLNKKSTLRIVRLCATLSRFVSVITYNGETARAVHESIGYRSDRSVVVPNGCDLEKYFHVNGAYETLCDELRIQDKKLILSVARYHPQKDIPNFLSAFAQVHQRMDDAVAVMCGTGISRENEDIAIIADRLGLVIGRDVFLLGMRDDTPMLLSACSLYALHSAGEAFPNTLIEAMACEALCVATDVGDAGKILGNDWFVVPAQNCIALADAMYDALLMDEKEARATGKSNRERVAARYSIEEVVKGYEALY